MSAPLLIAFDPGYDRLGWAVGRYSGEQWQDLAYGCLESSKKQTLTERYKQIMQALQQLIEKYQPQEAALESLFWAHNQSTALQVSQARGLIMTLLLQKNIQIFEYTPLQVKQSVTGYGRADKKAVEKMVRAELGIKAKLLDDTLDALAVMLCHQASRRLQQLAVKAL